MSQWLSAGRQRLGGVGLDPCLSPKYPKYVPSLAAKPQQCLPSSPPPSDPGSARRSACRQGPEAPPLPREEPRPAWRSLRGPRAGADRASDCAGLAWPSYPELLFKVHMSTGCGRPASPSLPLGNGPVSSHSCLVRMLGTLGHGVDQRGIRSQAHF